MKKVLVTGASGFLGRYLPPHLNQSFGEIVVVGRSPWPGNLSSVKFHRADLLSDDHEALDEIGKLRADTLIHVAWCTEPGAYWTSIDNLKWMAASLNLVENFIRNGGRRVVVVGTCAEYDWRYQMLVERETPLNPSTLYGQAKASLNKTLQTYADIHQVSFAWAHIFFPYGPYEKRRRLLSDLTFNLLNDIEMPVTAGAQIRDFMHVDDVAAGVAALAASEVNGPVNIASGDPRRLRDIIEMLAEATGRPHLVKYGARPPIFNDPLALTASVKRLKEEVGFRPRFTLEDGLNSTVDWWRKQLATT
ncbi:NAD(P)-dependent oxidoreductase [Rhizobium sp. OAE497]|uniref:NAD-dependent epimerase/dehydratase family protein n=1 Tax=Rhizobium sp. OAE497 TaxID=2663796 RepID=UPI0018F3E2E9